MQIYRPTQSVSDGTHISFLSRWLGYCLWFHNFISKRISKCESLVKCPPFWWFLIEAHHGCHFTVFIHRLIHSEMSTGTHSHLPADFSSLHLLWFLASVMVQNLTGYIYIHVPLFITCVVPVAFHVCEIVMFAWVNFRFIVDNLWQNFYDICSFSTLI